MTVPFSFREKGFFPPFLETCAVFLFLFLSFSTMHFLVSTLSPLSSTPPAESGLVCAKRRSLKRKKRPFFSFFANAIFSQGDFFSFPWRTEDEEGTGSGSIFFDFFFPYTRSFAKKKIGREKAAALKKGFESRFPGSGSGGVHIAAAVF